MCHLYIWFILLFIGLYFLSSSIAIVKLKQKLYVSNPVTGEKLLRVIMGPFFFFFSFSSINVIMGPSTRHLPQKP